MHEQPIERCIDDCERIGDKNPCSASRRSNVGFITTERLRTSTDERLLNEQRAKSSESEHVSRSAAAAATAATFTVSTAATS
jgi:hypothetical protein